MAAELSPGERRVREKQRRKWLILGGLMLAGAIPGFVLGYSEGEGLLDASGVWPAWIVALLSVSYLVTIGGTLWARQLDEHQLLGKYKAASFAGGMLLLVYPVWFLLWMGALAPEPIHWVLFLVFYGSLIGADIFYQLRGPGR